jgi:hypothetical protein
MRIYHAGTIGAYDAWPAQVIEALVALGHPHEGLALLRSIANGNAVNEPPFGQAHTLFVAESNGYTVRQPPTLCNTTQRAAEGCVARKSEQWMMQAYNAASAAFANAIIRGMYGFQPPWPFGSAANSSALALLEPAMCRGFVGSLKQLNWRGSLWTISSDKAAGLSLLKEAPEPT